MPLFLQNAFRFWEMQELWDSSTLLFRDFTFDTIEPSLGLCHWCVNLPVMENCRQGEVQYSPTITGNHYKTVEALRQSVALK